jgi:hypothetical protein
MDKFGCYETAEDGSTYYVNFWSEEARKYIMGNLTAPYTNVVDYCYTCKDGTMGMGEADGNSPAGRSRSLLSSKTYNSHGDDSHGRYVGTTTNEFYDDGSMRIVQNWDYPDNGGHLTVDVNVTGYDDDDGYADVQGSETYTDGNGVKNTKIY